MSLAVLSVLGLLAFANAGVPYKFDPRIINGEEVKPGEVTFMVSIQVKLLDMHFCGGTILNENYVVTAAHCVKNMEPRHLEILAGGLDLDKPSSTHQIEEIIMHEKYDPNDSFKHDIALLKVKTPFQESKNISFVKLPAPNDAPRTNNAVVVYGWGALREGGPSPKKLQRAVIKITDQKKCARVYENISLTVHDTQICANDPEVVTGACSGDSGGPMIFNGKFVGIVSWSLGCALTDYPTVYTRLHPYLGWIKFSSGIWPTTN